MNLFRRIVIGDDAVHQRPDGIDARVRVFLDELRLVSDGDNLLRLGLDRDDAGLIKNDLVILEYHRVGRAQVNSQPLS